LRGAKRQPEPFSILPSSSFRTNFFSDYGRYGPQIASSTGDLK